MKKNEIDCDSCEFRGYSPDFCKLHHKRIAAVDAENCDVKKQYIRMGKTMAMGAGVGVVAATVGIAAVLPAIGLKAAIGHSLAAKLTAGGGAAGAGLSVARRDRKNHSNEKQNRKDSVLLPLYLKKGS